MHELDPLHKKPFLRFLLWVYMKTGSSDKIQTGSVILFHDLYVSYIARMLKYLATCMNCQGNMELFGTC